MGCSHNHSHRVNETRKRSLLKAILGRIVEITIGTLIFGTILTFIGIPYPYELGFGLNVAEETLCFLVTYGTERIWNKISWGRTVEDVNETK